MALRREFIGVHELEDTGRFIRLTIHLDGARSPSRLISVALGMEGRSLQDLAQALAQSETCYAKALSRILGNESYRARLATPPNQVFCFMNKLFSKHHPVEFPLPSPTLLAACVDCSPQLIWNELCRPPVLPSRLLNGLYMYSDDVVSIQVLSLEHLTEQYTDDINCIGFEVKHRDELDSKLSSADLVHFVSLEGVPYLIGDYNRANPTGVLEPAASVELLDLIWLDADFVIVGPVYTWRDQYLCDIQTSLEAKSSKKTRDTLRRILYDQIVPAVEYLPQCRLGDLVHFRDVGRADDLQLLKGTVQKNQVYVAGPRGLVVREGMGAEFNMPTNVVNLAPGLRNIYGVISGFKRLDNEDLLIKIQVYLGKNNIPSWILSRLTGAQQLQTNHHLWISALYLESVFLYWPSSLLQGSCVSNHDKVVVGHLNFPSLDTDHARDGVCGCDSDGLSDSSSITKFSFQSRDDGFSATADVLRAVQPMMDMLQRKTRVEINRVCEMRAHCALAVFAQQDRLLLQVNHNMSSYYPPVF